MEYGEEKIKALVKDYVLKEMLPGESSDQLDHDTPLISGGIIDSVSILGLVGYLETTFDVRVEAHETDADYMETIDHIAAMIVRKRAERTSNARSSS